MAVMNRVRRLRPTAPKPSSLPSMLIGTVVGCALMYLVMIPITISGRGLRFNSESAGDEGWGDIHVYYGQRTAVLSLPSTSDQKLAAFSSVEAQQDKIVMDLLGSKGYFIDLAAGDARELSNTLGLELDGWNGLCIEPNPAFWYSLSHRKCTVVAAVVGGTQTKSSQAQQGAGIPSSQKMVDVKFRGIYGGVVGKMDDEKADRKGEPEVAVQKRFLIDFEEILKRFKAPRTIDYLSLDVEGAEHDVLQGFPFKKYKIRLLTVEKPTAACKQLLEQNGYILLKVLTSWGETLWGHKSTGLKPDHPKIVQIETQQEKEHH